MKPLLLLPLILLLACKQSTSVSQQNKPESQASISDTSLYTKGPQSYDGIGKYYMGREISEVMGHFGAGWLERPEREEEEKGSLLLKALELKPTDVIADIGAGSGYFSFRMAPMVSQGKVIAEDIQPEMLDIMREKQKKNGIQNIEYILGTEKTPKLSPSSIDWAIMVDVYHELSFPREMMDNIVAALKPTGKFALVEYRAEDPDVPIKPRHKMTEAQAVKEMKAVGLKLIENKTILPRQHLMIFGK